MVYLKDFGLSSIISFLWTFINRKMKLQNSVKGIYKDQQSRDIIAVQECILFLFRTECTDRESCLGLNVQREREREVVQRLLCLGGQAWCNVEIYKNNTLWQKMISEDVLAKPSIYSSDQKPFGLWANQKSKKTSLFSYSRATS